MDSENTAVCHFLFDTKFTVSYKKWEDPLVNVSSFLLKMTQRMIKNSFTRNIMYTQQAYPESMLYNYFIRAQTKRLLDLVKYFSTFIDIKPFPVTAKLEVRNLQDSYLVESIKSDEHALTRHSRIKVVMKPSKEQSCPLDL